MISLAPADFASLHFFEAAFGGWKVSSRAQQKLAQILLTEPEMEPQPQQEE